MVLRLPDSWSNWNLEMLVFEERGKPEYQEKNLSEQGREPTTTSTHIWRQGRIWTRATLVGGECSHHCATLAPLKYKPPGGLYLEGRFNGGSTALRVWGLIFEGAYKWRGLFSEFYGILLTQYLGESKLTSWRLNQPGDSIGHGIKLKKFYKKTFQDHDFSTLFLVS